MIFLPLVVKIGTPRFRRLLTYMVPLPIIHRLRKMTDIMDETSIRVLREKQHALEKGEAVLQEQIAVGKVWTFSQP